MGFVIRPATKADIDRFASSLPATPTVRAFVAEVDGQPIALGGVAIVAGRHLAFCDLTHKDAAAHKMQVARAAWRFMADVKRRGTRYVYAKPDRDEPTAERWLASLGFQPDPNNPDLYRWSSSAWPPSPH